MFKKLLIASIALLGMSTAQAMDSCYTGLWYDSDRDGEGVSIEASEDRVLAFFYTFDTNFKQRWHLFLGEDETSLVAYDVLKFSDDPFETETYPIGEGSFEVLNENAMIFRFEFTYDYEDVTPDTTFPWCLKDVCEGKFIYKRLTQPIECD